MKSMHADARKNLEVALDHALRTEFHIMSGSPVTRDGYFLVGYRLAKQAADSVHEIVDTHQAYTEIHRIILNNLPEHERSHRTTPLRRLLPEPSSQMRPLAEVVGPTGIDTIKSSILQFFASLPRKYRILVPVGSPPDDSTWEVISITNDMRLHSFHLTPERLDEQTHDNPPILPQTYLEVDSQGYGDANPESSAVAPAWDKIREALVVGRLSGLFMPRPRRLGFRPRESYEENTMYHYELTSVPPDFLAFTAVDLSDRTRTHLSQYRIKPIGDDANGAKLEAGLRASLGPVFDPAREKDTEPIRAAAMWEFESNLHTNETISFLLVCIGIEAILGPGTKSTERGLTQTLADRYAYLLAGNLTARDDRRAKFEELYDVRSKLVHGSTRRLEGKDRESYNFAREVLIEVITQEVRGLPRMKQRRGD